MLHNNNSEIRLNTARMFNWLIQSTCLSWTFSWRKVIAIRTVRRPTAPTAPADFRLSRKPPTICTSAAVADDSSAATSAETNKFKILFQKIIYEESLISYQTFCYKWQQHCPNYQYGNTSNSKQYNEPVMMIYTDVHLSIYETQLLYWILHGVVWCANVASTGFFFTIFIVF